MAIGVLGPSGGGKDPQGDLWGLRAKAAASRSQTHPSVPRPAVFEQRLAVSSLSEFKVENPRGRILIRDGPPDQLVLRIESNLPIAEEMVRLKVEKNRASLRTMTRHEEQTLDVYLTVPPGLRLQAKTEDGTVQVHGRPRAVRVETLSGDVILGIPVEDLKAELVWTEGYVRYAGPPLPRIEQPVLPRSSTQSVAPPPAVLAGKIGQGRLAVHVRTLNGWVELGPPTASDRVIMGLVPPQPMTRAARVLAENRWSVLGEALRRLEPRLARIVEMGGPVPWPAASAEEEDAIRLEAPLVNLLLSVTDAEGKVLSGLTTSDFTVFEDGLQQEVRHFAVETSPFNLVLLLDVSGSTRGQFEAIRQAARRFLELMRPEDKVALLLFARDVEVVAALTSDRDQVKRALDTVVPPLGSTALYDAIGYALAEVLGPVRGQRNALVVLTDGRDSSFAYQGTPLWNDPLRRPGSFLRFEDLVLGVLQSDALIYPIMFENEAELAAALSESGREQVRVGTRVAEEQLRRLADLSGGRFYRVRSLDQLEGVYEQIAADLRTIYSLAYMPTRVERDGSWRQIEVRVARRGARVRTRPGYFAR
ncbi:MAG: VWA domain-containing protein [Blastocatellia bacterium]|nr:VWA domain-containing protein [Blastocatellia bacterium]MCX7751693.1 VWA domain-containing protein [Blastocatellia bacterium]MDW8168794.1 VWA domain-containing protein [Acidobacteriota bacterium]MDW8255667.1 VWA domain-containing protein [Acidobacteriota bacterium]